MINLHQTPTTHYRVEYHDGHAIHQLGCLIGVTPQRTSLEPFVRQLLRDEETGTLLLVHHETGEIVAQRVIKGVPNTVGDRPLKLQG